MIENAIQTKYPQLFPKIEKLERENEASPYDEIISWFFEGSGFELLDHVTDKDYKATLDEVTPLENLIQKYQPETSPEDRYFLKEFILWGLVQYKKLSKYRFTDGVQFKDLYGSYISGL